MFIARWLACFLGDKVPNIRTEITSGCCSNNSATIGWTCVENVLFDLLDFVLMPPANATNFNTSICRYRISFARFRKHRWRLYVVSSGLRVHATARMTKGMETMIVSCKIMNSWLCDAAGFVMINGRGKVIINQITERRIIISSFFFLFGFTWCLNYRLY